ncbi:MAG: response regulator [Phycisphaeraceae bacterium]|nr:response regulator [Phycisphaeraceae bacterium]
MLWSREDEHEPIDILLVEDNPADVRLTCEVFKATHMHCRISVVEDGEAAVEYLRRAGPYEAAPTPALILLDLNLPRKDGQEVLAEIKGDSRLRRIPVIVLTSSSSVQDVNACYDLLANCFVVKPSSLDAIVETVRSIEEFWLGRVCLPLSNGLK